MIILKRIALSLCLAGTLTACEEGVNPVSDVQNVFGGSTSSAGLSPAQRELRQRERAYSNARLQAALIGGGLGALGGILSGADEKETALYAVVGAAGGYYVGAALVQQNASFQTAQSVLQDDITRARQDTSRLQQSVASAQSALDYQRSEISRLNAGLRASDVTAAQYRARYQTMQGDLQATRSLRQSAERRVSGLQSSINGYRSKNVNTSQLNSELGRQQQRLTQIRAIERAMIGNLNNVPSNVRSGS